MKLKPLKLFLTVLVISSIMTHHSYAQDTSEVEQTTFKKREEAYRLLLHPPGAGWQVNEDEEKAVLANEQKAIATAKKTLKNYYEPIVYHSYIKDGQVVSTNINFPRPAQTLAMLVAQGRGGYSQYPNNSPVMIKGYQGIYYEYTKPRKPSEAHQLEVFVGSDTMVSFASTNTLSKEWLIQYANTMDYDKILPLQPKPQTKAPSPR